MTVNAVVVDPRDNVASLILDLSAGEVVRTEGGEGPVLRADIAMGHKVALRDLVEGEPVIKYGQRIGWATAAIAAGEHVHLHNLAGGTR